MTMMVEQRFQVDPDSRLALLAKTTTHDDYDAESARRAVRLLQSLVRRRGVAAVASYLTPDDLELLDDVVTASDVAAWRAEHC